MNTSSMDRFAGLALICAGVLEVVLNSVLTPLLPHGVPFAQTVASTVFAWRQSLASVCAILLQFGTVGLYLRQSEKAGKLGAVAFALAFCGSALLLCMEWAQLFDIRDFARRSPDTLNALNAAHGLSLSDIGGLAVLGTFTLGWLALAAVTIWTRIPSRMAASMVLIGFFLILILRPILPGLLGPIIGNVVLGGGWAGLGVALWRDRATAQSKSPVEG
ncbi:MAG TPA: hypothetical protein VIW73_01530 [Candidatus Cybelea sp.]